jgi:hypothetical protein
MDLTRLLKMVAAAALAGCAEQTAPMSDPVTAVALPTITVAVEERPAPPAITLADRLRDEAWLTRFWEQLNPSQQRRVVRQLRMSIPPRVKDEGEAGPVWDALGLPERDALIFGPGLHEFERAVRRRQG